MCAIAGKIYFRKGFVTQKELLLMSNKLVHRGPDDAGIYISKDKRVGLANRRLAIIDLSHAGHQPMSYKNRYWITYNGEIYNFLDERKKLEKLGYRFHSNTDWRNRPRKQSEKFSWDRIVYEYEKLFTDLNA